MKMLETIKKRLNDDTFEVEDDNEFDRVKQIVVMREQLKEKEFQIKRDANKYTDLEYRKEIKNIDKQKKQKDAVISHLKHNFRHINGMWPKTANFTSEEDRMQSWQTSLVIKKKIFKPSKRIVVCQQGVQDLQKKHGKYDEFLKNFRRK